MDDSSFNLKSSSSAGSDSRSFAELRALKRELIEELRASFREGEPVPVENLLQRWPDNPETDSDVASLLFEEYCQRARRGDSLCLEEHLKRYPAQRAEVTRIVYQQSFRQALGSQSSSSPLRLPQIGESVFGFTLWRKLGQGAFAQVFLARQANLAGRLVVLKVSSTEGTEPQTLAQLQHTHIVPIYSIHEDVRAGLRAVCMPYFGGVSLNHILDELRDLAPVPTSGQELMAALERASLTTHESLDSGADPGEKSPPQGNLTAESPRLLLAHQDFFQSTAWIVARLAEGLHHAHQRGVLHRDIKPSNILICADGQPMLLDFNLSQQIGIDPADATMGGTLAYMAPEHLRALGTRELSARGRVDARADIYSLGMVLYETLTGQRAFNQSASHTPLPLVVEAMAVERSTSPPSPRLHRPDIPWSLESITRKCLDPDPERRYQSPKDLAEDLRRFLEDRPLRYAPELSMRERVQKWTRRHPRACAVAGVTLVASMFLMLLGYLLIGSQASLTKTTQELSTTQAQSRKQASDRGTARALLLVNTIAPEHHQPLQHLREGLKVCKETLRLYGVTSGNRLESHPDWSRLTEKDQQELADNLQELLLLLAGGQVRLKPDDKQTLIRSEHLLDLAAQLPKVKPSRALWEDRATYLEKLGELSLAEAARRKAASIKPTSARDHYLLATSLARKGKLQQAIERLDRSLKLNPQHYWSWVQRGLCHLELSKPALALGDFSTCVGLWPDHPWGYFNRGVALDRLGHHDDAIVSYTTALEKDSGFVLARLNRALACLESQKNQAALNDFDLLIEQQHSSSTEATIHLGRGVALERLGQPAEADKAFAKTWPLAESLPEAQQRRFRWVYGFAIALRSPEEAKRAFEQVLQSEPTHPQALYGLAMIYDRMRRPVEAAEHYNRAIQASPTFVEPRRFRALFFARQGRAEHAIRDINWCLQKEPESGATLYAAACVLALLAESPDQREQAPALREQAFSFLEKAFQRNYGQDRAAEDEDLSAIQTSSRFRELLKQVGKPGCTRGD